MSLGSSEEEIRKKIDQKQRMIYYIETESSEKENEVQHEINAKYDITIKNLKSDLLATINKIDKIIEEIKSFKYKGDKQNAKACKVKKSKYMLSLRDLGRQQLILTKEKSKTFAKMLKQIAIEKKRKMKQHLAEIKTLNKQLSAIIRLSGY